MVVLDPTLKDGYFKKYWGQELHKEVMKNAEKLVCLILRCLDISNIVIVPGVLQQAIWKGGSFTYHQAEEGESLQSFSESFLVMMKIQLKRVLELILSLLG